MTETFVDTSCWAALFLADDALNAVASARFQDELESSSLITSEEVLGEFLTLVGRRAAGRRSHAAEYVQNVRGGGIVVLPQTSEHFDATLSFFAARGDKEYSFVDCSTMVFMRRRGIRRVLSHDHHFVQEGFDALLRDRPP